MHKLSEEVVAHIDSLKESMCNFWNSVCNITSAEYQEKMSALFAALDDFKEIQKVQLMPPGYKE
jgi:hypothetical protein